MSVYTSVKVSNENSYKFSRGPKRMRKNIFKTFPHIKNITIKSDHDTK